MIISKRYFFEVTGGVLVAMLAGLIVTPALANQTEKPKVIVIMRDDQGYGDLSCHGNPVLKTPNLNRLYANSVRFTDFHVSPMCTPTRGQLMTGIDAMSNGATYVCQGRSMMRRDFKLMPYRPQGWPA